MGVRWISSSPTKTCRRAEIDPQALERKDRLARFARTSAGVPQGHAQAGQQFADAERLGQIIVGPGVQGLDLLVFLAAGRKDHDRHLRPLADLPDHLHAVDVGQSQVEDHQIRLLAGGLHARRRGRVSASTSR